MYSIIQYHETSFKNIFVSVLLYNKDTPVLKIKEKISYMNLIIKNYNLKRFYMLKKKYFYVYFVSFLNKLYSFYTFFGVNKIVTFTFQKATKNETP